MGGYLVSVIFMETEIGFRYGMHAVQFILSFYGYLLIEKLTSAWS